MKRIMLYFGSFNPVHRGHIALAEYVVGQGLCDEAVLVVSPQSPYKQAAELAPEMDRFEMAEIACAASKYPERIKPSVVEFLLPKPSYTIDTLRYLKENFGSGMQFSILMGSDQIARLAGWKEYEQILEYPVYVYPRRGEPAEGFEGRITPLTDAPLVAVTPPDFPWTEDTIPLARLLQEPFLSSPEQYVEQYLPPEVPRLEVTASDDGAILSMVAAGLGVSVLSAFSLAGYENRVKVIPLTQPLSRRLGVAVKSMPAANSSARLFLSFLKHQYPNAPVS